MREIWFGENLTLTLSHPERELQRAGLPSWGIIGFAGRLPRIPPLPAGVGRGEENFAQ
jgi:hypothetical protein